VDWVEKPGKARTAKQVRRVNFQLVGDDGEPVGAVQGIRIPRKHTQAETHAALRAHANAVIPTFLVAPPADDEVISVE